MPSTLSDEKRTYVFPLFKDGATAYARYDEASAQDEQFWIEEQLAPG